VKVDVLSSEGGHVIGGCLCLCCPVVV
jgi:hypothetical protein